MKRIKKVQQALEQMAVDSIVISHPIDLSYLLGMSLSAGTLVIEKKKAHLLVDGRYLEICQSNLKINVQRDAPDVLAKIVAPSHRIGFAADTTSYSRFLHLQQQLEGRLLVALFKPIEKIRAIKEKKEVKAIAKACQLLERGFEFLCSRVRKGVTERMLAQELEIFWIGQGADGLAFEPIIAFGKNSSKPHYRAAGACLTDNEAILVDIGVVVDGYASDMTRMIFCGKPHKKFAEIYGIVKEAQESAIAACKPGITAEGLYDQAMNVIADAGYREAFLHSLGHGIGLETHEYPTLKKEPNSCVIQPGMVLTVEPGIYLPGIGGVRLEDMIVVTEEGCETLTSCPKKVLLNF